MSKEGGWVPPSVRFAVLQRKIWTTYSSFAPMRERLGQGLFIIDRLFAPGFSTSPGTLLAGGEQPEHYSLDNSNMCLTVFLPQCVGKYGWNGIGVSSMTNYPPALSALLEPLKMLSYGVQCSKRWAVSHVRRILEVLGTGHFIGF